MGFDFSLYGILGLVLYAGCIIHAIRTGRINYWLFILIFIPGLGSILYLLFEVLPGRRSIPTGACARAGPTWRSSTLPRTGASSPRSA